MFHALVYVVYVGGASQLLGKATVFYGVLNSPNCLLSRMIMLHSVSEVMWIFFVDFFFFFTIFYLNIYNSC